MVEIKKYSFKSKDKLIIPICTNCLNLLVDKQLKLESELHQFFEDPKRIGFCSKECKKEYLNNNPLVAHQIAQLKAISKRKNLPNCSSR